jgi:hypothetical protein
MKEAVTGVTGKHIFTDHWRKVNQRVFIVRWIQIKQLGKPFSMFSNALYLLNLHDSSKKKKLARFLTNLA